MLFRLLLVLAIPLAYGATPEELDLSGDIAPIHDPAIAKEGKRFYVFASNRFRGQLVPMFETADLRSWKFAGHVFDAVPQWASDAIPGARGIWAPDISFTDGEFRLYYAVSTFGSNRSVIGLATNRTLDPTSPLYHWVDQGLVIESNAPGASPDDWNAIDPNVEIDRHGDAWLALGSFWSGIKLRKLDRATGKLSTADTHLYSIANRKPRTPPAIEAPFIVRHGSYFYLFVSFDLCCRGATSTYRIMVGRAKEITGPYVDRNGVGMLDGGGSELLAGSAAWRGPGGESVLLHSGVKGDILVYHAYEGTTGKPTLHISTISWEGGWPRAGQLPRVYTP